MLTDNLNKPMMLAMNAPGPGPMNPNATGKQYRS